MAPQSRWRRDGRRWRGGGRVGARGLALARRSRWREGAGAGAAVALAPRLLALTWRRSRWRGDGWRWRDGRVGARGLALAWRSPAPTPTRLGLAPVLPFGDCAVRSHITISAEFWKTNFGLAEACIQKVQVVTARGAVLLRPQLPSRAHDRTRDVLRLRACAAATRDERSHYERCRRHTRWSPRCILTQNQQLIHSPVVRRHTTVRMAMEGRRVVVVMLQNGIWTLAALVWLAKRLRPFGLCTGSSVGFVGAL